MAQEATPAPTPRHKPEENAEQDTKENVIGETDQSAKVDKYRTAEETSWIIGTSIGEEEPTAGTE